MTERKDFDIPHTDAVERLEEPGSRAKALILAARGVNGYLEALAG